MLVNPEDPEVKIHYTRLRAHVQKVLKDIYWKYVSSIFTFENDSLDPDTPKTEEILKKWPFIKSLKKTRLGSHHSEKTEFLGQMQRKKKTF